VLEETIRVSQESGNVMVAAGALTQAARLHVRRGQLYEAKTVLDRAIELATDERGRALPVAGRAMITLGDLLREWNDLDAAVQTIEQGIALIEQWRGVAALPGYIALSRARQSRGDVAGAVEAVQKARQLAKATDATDWDDVLVDIYQARLWIVQGNVAAAVRWAERQVVVEPEQGDELVLHHMQKYEDVVQARLAIAQGRHDEALALLESLHSMLENQDRQQLIIEIQILKALALSAKARSRGNTLAQAVAALERALHLAEPGGYVRIFVDEGRPMAELLSTVRRQRSVANDRSPGKRRRPDVSPDYLQKLLEAFDVSRSPAQVADLQPEALLEPLSERELEVLRLLTTRLSTPEIAQQLIISVHTVRSHIKSIYGKLGVHRRADALERAESLGLL
jgi:LuxR family maltose regulon positive regulatory protein